MTRILVLRSPGANCDAETAFAFEKAGGQADCIHVNQLIEEPKLMNDYQVFCIPGGFSYGDDISAGRILGKQLQTRLQAALQEFQQAEKLLLGICNGFQTLMNSGLLVSDAKAATLTDNDSGKFDDRWVNLKVHGSNCVFLRDIETLELPIAHAEGKFVVRDSATLEQLESAGQLSLRYIGNDGADSPAYPANPNGSAASTAGVCDESGRVFGLMPHPERYIDPTQHPRWTRGDWRDPGDGLKLFQNAVSYFA
ncbi:MAG: phosphoribosylformylglycinamidine synthase I [bacterium]|nr:phosphoribosylformylglycinamidine synthase I [bacterium]